MGIRIIYESGARMEIAKPVPTCPLPSLFISVNLRSHLCYTLVFVLFTFVKKRVKALSVACRIDKESDWAKLHTLGPTEPFKHLAHMLNQFKT